MESWGEQGQAEAHEDVQKLPVLMAPDLDGLDSAEVSTLDMQLSAHQGWESEQLQEDPGKVGIFSPVCYSCQQDKPTDKEQCVLAPK